MKPFIAITPHQESVSEQDRYLLGVMYAKAVEAAGGVPVILPYLTNDNLLGIIPSIHGILLSGGGDVEPHHYGEKPSAELKAVVADRDRADLLLCRAGFEHGRPILGVCRGMQVINVAFGGTLFQDIPAETNAVQEHFQKTPRWMVTHSVSITRETRLGECYRNDRARVNSFHHQAVREVAPGFKAVSWSEDGLIEGIENDADVAVFGIQWHPECLWEKYTEHLGPFVALVAEATRVAKRVSA